ncbi:hypothetical protein MTO96_007346 [Rhipicephalus appendiculatus]
MAPGPAGQMGFPFPPHAPWCELAAPTARLTDFAGGVRRPPIAEERQLHRRSKPAALSSGNFVANSMPSLPSHGDAVYEVGACSVKLYPRRSLAA